MPFRAEKIIQSGQDYSNPFVGPINHTVMVPVDLSALTDDEIDQYGWLKPGIPLNKDGTLIGTGDTLFGVTVEATKVLADNAAATIAAAGIQNIAVVTTATQVNQDIAEDNLGRVYTSDEIASFAGTGITLL